MTSTLPAFPAPDGWVASWIEPVDVEVTVPDGTDVELVLPGGASEVLAPGTHDRTWA